MSDIVHTGNRLKREALLHVFMSLCVLIILYGLSPHMSQLAEKYASSSLSISLYCQDYALVSVASAVRNNLRSVNHAKDSIQSKTASVHGAGITSQGYLQFVVNLSWNSSPLCGLAGSPEIGRHRGCQLLDIPPPSNTLSF
jgi:hypothetical protein